MSTIAGLVSLNESPESVAGSFNLIFDALAHRAGSPERWQNGHCALGARVPPGLCDGLEKSHAAHAPTGCAIVFDGRLDNREELLSQLPDLASGATPLDAEIVLHAYLHWVEDSASKLLGDFAFAVWDPRIRTLYAARDPLGVRPFFYTVNAERIAFASQFKSLLALPGVTRTPDDFMVSEFLLWWSSFPDITHTFFRDIRRLVPAHWLRWNAKGLELHRYWAVDPSRRLRYRSHQEYVEHFDSLFSRAVSDRRRGVRRVGLFLSGGMDSSSIAGMCGRLANPAVQTHAYSTQMPSANDESHLARLAAQKAGIGFRTCPIAAVDFVHRFEAQVTGQVVPLVDLGSFNEVKMLGEAAADGCGLVLTGDGADELFNFPWAYVADLVCKLRLRKLVRELGPYSHYNCHPPLEMLQLSARYALPLWVTRVWKTLKWQQPPAWINPEFAQRTAVVQRLREVRPWLPFDSMSASVDYDAMTRGRRVLVDENRELRAQQFGMHYRYPFYDCRVLQFMWAIPWEEKVTDGRVKSFLREIPGLLPAEISGLKQKADYTDFTLQVRAAQQWHLLKPLFDTPPAQAGEYLNLTVAREICAAYLRDREERNLPVFGALAALLIWLKTYA